jgi:GT2 family glycosyltransferase
MRETVAAVVVTFNRKVLLLQCLDSLLKQSRSVDKILIVDNASTDGTAELLREKGYLKNSVIDYIQLPENTGGAGGFHEGMKRAYEAGYDWLWLMDDDGYPAATALEEILKVSTELDIIGAAVVLPNDASKLSWKLRILEPSGYFKPRAYLTSYSELVEHSSNEIYEGLANYFNAILFSRKTIEIVGFVQKELFIWGDDYEYSLRCKAANLRIGTCIKALYFHPEKLSGATKLKYYYFMRNLYYTYAKYGKLIYSPLIRPLYPFYIPFRWLHILPSINPCYLWQVIKASYFAGQGKLIPYQL